ncbi:MAG: hypothetical protein A2Z77_05260 [Chloroflexi bacterium RBG_13_51_36]|nr:MAG: hypothetical protein A2Z77_05260 [Chloroflexi bacterium RBG_13_51_36]
MSSPKIRLAPEQKEKLLRNIWLLHDGRWFLKSVEQFGFDAATKLNLAVVKSIARTEMRQLLAETSFGEVRNTKDLQALMEIASLLYFPEEHKYEFKVLDNNTFVGHVLECYVHKMVSKAGTTAIHRCAARLRFYSWCQAMRLDGEVMNEKDTNNCNGTCDIIFKIKW